MPKVVRPRQSQPATNWLEATRQMWKLYVALLGFGLALIGFLGAGFSLLFDAVLFAPLMIGGTLVGGITFGWLITTLRCPNCRARLVLTMLSSRSHMSWLVDLTNLSSCPSCQSTLTPRASARWRAIS